MNDIYRKIFLLFFIFSCSAMSNFLKSAELHHVSQGYFKVKDLIKEKVVYYYESSDTSSSINKIILNDENGMFKKVLANGPEYNFNSRSVAWLRFTIKSKNTRTLYLDPGLADFMNLYVVRNGKIIKTERQGMLQPLSHLTDPYFFRYFRLEVTAGETTTYYLSLQNKYPLSIVSSVLLLDDVYFWHNHFFLQYVFKYLFFGASLIMIFYNLFLFITAKDRTYLMYVCYMLSIFISSFVEFRLYYFVFPSWADYPEIFNFISVASGQVIGILYILFAGSFINYKKVIPGLHRFNATWFKIRGLSIPVVLFLFFGPFKINLLHYGHFTDILLGIVNLSIVYYSRNRLGKYFVWGGVMLVIGASITVLESVGIILFGQRSYTIPLQIGILGELVFFSVGLGIRVKLSELEKRITERQLLNQLLENEKLQTQVNRELEEKVKERTTEIEKRNQEILKQNVLLVEQKEELQVQAAAIQKANEAVREKNEALQESLEKLKIAQAELVQSEKMASLGLLTAGIAHEINNPINFVSANVRPIKNDFTDIKELFQKYKKLPLNEDNKELLKQIREYEKSIDADYLFQEIDLLLNGIEEGAVRTREIVLGLKSFSRTEEHDFKPSNIHAGLDSTLMLLQGRIKNKITIQRNYAPDLPMVECYPGKINQVFMNIITNAIQAIEGKGEIRITTLVEGESVKICIKDNGIGIPGEVKEKIFQPFFTTKEIGKGTGLGLSISYGIIEDHHGKIEVLSEPGKGSEFRICLPVKQPGNSHK